MLILTSDILLLTFNKKTLKTTILTTIILSILLLSGCNNQSSTSADSQNQNEITPKNQIYNELPKGGELSNADKEKTFDSANLKISFSTPSDWDVQERVDGKNIDIETSNYKKSDSACGGSFGKIWITITPNQNELSIPDLYDTFNDTSRFWPKKFSFDSFTSKNGLNGIQFPLIDENISDKNCPARTVTDLLDPKNKIVISIHYFHVENKSKIIEEQYQNMIDSIIIK